MLLLPVVFLSGKRRCQRHLQPLDFLLDLVHQQHPAAPVVLIRHILVQNLLLPSVLVLHWWVDLVHPLQRKVVLVHPRVERLVRNLLLPSVALVVHRRVDLERQLLLQLVALDHRKQMLLE